MEKLYVPSQEQDAETRSASQNADAPGALERKQQLKEKTNELLHRIENGIQEILSSNQYQDYLHFVSKFHRYSFNNTILIYTQRPDATHVAGYTDWQKKFHRNVTRGAKGITIFRPQQVKYDLTDKNGDPILDENGEPKQRSYIKFYPVPVFDVSDTAGAPLPELPDYTLKDNVKNYDTFLQALTSASKYPIEFEEIEGKAYGYCDRHTQRIAIQKGLPQLQTIKTALHEIAHSYLHDSDSLPPREYREVEAETTAYIVADHFGLDTSQYSFAYLASWGQQDFKELRASIQKCIKQADELIVKTEDSLKELQREAVHTQAQENSMEQPAAIPAEKFSDIDALSASASAKAAGRNKAISTPPPTKDKSTEHDR